MKQPVSFVSSLPRAPLHQQAETFKGGLPALLKSPTLTMEMVIGSPWRLSEEFASTSQVRQRGVQLPNSVCEVSGGKSSPSIRSTLIR
jgi:hypothetical protein